MILRKILALPARSRRAHWRDAVRGTASAWAMSRSPDASLRLAPRPGTRGQRARNRRCSECSAAYFDSDPRLGPARLPVTGNVGAELSGYLPHRRPERGAVPGHLLGPAANAGQGGWLYPPDDGYVVGPKGRAEHFSFPWAGHDRSSFPGQDIDRFGSEYGTFLSPEGIPYGARSIPPQSLDGIPAAACDYHRYRVIKRFTVDPGRSRRGLGSQVTAGSTSSTPCLSAQSGGLNVMWLVANGYVRPLGSCGPLPRRLRGHRALGAARGGRRGFRSMAAGCPVTAHRLLGRL